MASHGHVAQSYRDTILKLIWCATSGEEILSHVEKVERVPGAGAGHGHGGGPRAVVARGAPAGVPPPSEGIQSTISLTSKLFATVTITCPGLLWLLPWGSWSIQSGTGGGGRHARKAVCWRESGSRRLYNSPLLLSTLLSCCTLTTPLHPYCVATNRKLRFIVFPSSVATYMVSPYPLSRSVGCSAKTVVDQGVLFYFKS